MRNAFITLFFVPVLIIALQPSALAQAGGNEPDWQTLRDEEFTVVMPKDPKTEESKEPYHRMEPLTMRLYLSTTERGPVFAIVSLSGIKSNTGQYTEFARLNSYVDAFKNLFPQKVRGKDAVARLTLVGDKTLNGNSGREYRLVIGDLSGTAQVYTTRKRFYAVVMLNTKKDDALADRFLSSFALPEKMAPPATAAVVEERPAAPPGRQGNARGEKREPSDETPKPDANSEAAGDVKPAEAAAEKPQQPGQRAPISGGVLNGKALYLPTPDYPAEARTAGASGSVVVQVLIDEQGNVTSARAVSGHPLLQQAAVNAAQQARFSPTTLMGEPVKVTGVITFNFVR